MKEYTEYFSAIDNNALHAHNLALEVANSAIRASRAAIMADLEGATYMNLMNLDTHLRGMEKNLRIALIAVRGCLNELENFRKEKAERECDNHDDGL